MLTLLVEGRESGRNNSKSAATIAEILDRARWGTEILLIFTWHNRAGTPRMRGDRRRPKRPQGYCIATERQGNAPAFTSRKHPSDERTARV